MRFGKNTPSTTSVYIYKLRIIYFAPNMNRSEVEFRKANKTTVEEDRGTLSARVLAP